MVFLLVATFPDNQPNLDKNFDSSSNGAMFKSPNFLPLRQIEAQLDTYSTGLLKGYKYHALPLPDPIYVEGLMMSASYVNYLVLNGAVLVPCFDQAKDKEALSVIQNYLYEMQLFLREWIRR